MRIDISKMDVYDWVELITTVDDKVLHAKALVRCALKCSGENEDIGIDRLSDLLSEFGEAMDSHVSNLGVSVDDVEKWIIGG